MILAYLKMYKHKRYEEVLVAQLWLTLCDPMDYIKPTKLLGPWDSSGMNTGVGCHSRPRGQTQGSNPGVPHCRPLSHHSTQQDIRTHPPTQY